MMKYERLIFLALGMLLVLSLIAALFWTPWFWALVASVMACTLWLDESLMRAGCYP